MFANPGSTEIPLLAAHDERVRFVLGLHEATVTGAATGYALASGRPALVLLHTTAGFGNAVAALATARENRAPLVVVVGQQDRRHLAQRPFLAGDLDGLAGRYPVWSTQPALAVDVPDALERAWHEARTLRGPAVVVVPMDDWVAAAEPDRRSTARCELRAAGVDPAEVAPLAGLVDEAASPVLVAGADNDSEEGWAALVELADHLDCQVWQAPFAARAGFPQDHPRFAGHLPAGRARLRAALAGHDLVLAVGAPVLRQYPYEPGPLVAGGTTLAMVVDDPSLAHHSPVDLAVIGPLPGICRQLASMTTPGKGRRPQRSAPPASDPAPEPAAGRPPSPRQVFAALAARLPADAVVVEESPSSRPELQRLLPTRRPLGFLSAAMGGLGFALPAAVGVRMALPRRPVVAVVGDGSSLYAIHALWTAAHYRVGVLVVVLRNGRYAVMDRLAEANAARPAWPAFEGVDVATLAEGFGCAAARVSDLSALERLLDTVVAGLASADSPLLVQIDVTDQPHFAP